MEVVEKGSPLGLHLFPFKGNRNRYSITRRRNCTSGETAGPPFVSDPTPTAPNPMEVASLTETDSLPDVELDVRVVTAPKRETWCILCGTPVEAEPGPAIFLEGGWERVCRCCTRTHDPVVLNELKWKRADWKAARDEGPDV